MVRVVEADIAAVTEARSDVVFFNAARPEVTALEATLILRGRNDTTLEISTPLEAPPGAWRAAICDADGVQLGVIEIELYARMGHAEESPFAGTDDALVTEVLREYGDLTRRRAAALSAAGAADKTYLYELLADYPAARRQDAALEPVHRDGARARAPSVDDAIASAVSIELHAQRAARARRHRGRERRAPRHADAARAARHPARAQRRRRDGPARPASAEGQLSPARPGDRRCAIFEETERMAWESAEGQALELGWQRDNRTDIGDEDYLRWCCRRPAGSRRSTRCASAA